MKRLHLITVRGHENEWSLPVMAKRSDAADWRADGIEVIEPQQFIPAWVADCGLTRPWCWLQSLFNFRAPWR